MLSVLSRNWHLKLLAFVLAYAVWTAVAEENTLLRDFSVPLEIDLPQDFTLVSPTLTQVDVRLRGPESVLGRVDPFRMKVVVDLAESSPGERTVQLRETNLVGTPGGTEFVHVEPGQLSLQLDWKVRQRLTVEPTFVGELPEGYHLYDYNAVPGTLVVEGPKSVVESLDKLGTDPIQLNGRTEPFDARVGVVPGGNGVRVLEVRPLQVRVEVDASPVELVVDAVPVSVTGAAVDADLSPERLRLTLYGPPRLLASISRNRVRAVVDLEEALPRAEAYAMTPRIEFEGLDARQRGRIDVRDIEPETISVRVSEPRI